MRHIDLNWLKLIQIGYNWVKWSKTEWNWVKSRQFESNWFKLSGIQLKKELTQFDLVDTICLILVSSTQFKLIWSNSRHCNLILFNQIDISNFFKAHNSLTLYL
jgi:hypothetical protein